jgi:hypothetical protein
MSCLQTLRLYLLLCLAGCALAQTQPQNSQMNVIWDSPLKEYCWITNGEHEACLNSNDKRLVEVKLYPKFCDGTLKMGSSTRAIKDVFPVECSEGDVFSNEIHRYAPMPVAAPEPEDIPAIQGELRITTAEQNYPRDTDVGKAYESGFRRWCPNADRNTKDGRLRCKRPTQTCADKSRILETAEDGTKWCHKPLADHVQKKPLSMSKHDGG